MLIFLYTYIKFIKNKENNYIIFEIKYVEFLLVIIFLIKKKRCIGKYNVIIKIG